MAINNKFRLPPFLEGRVASEIYNRWLERKAAAHVKRDKGRGHTTANVKDYREAIHEAVLDSGGKDVYTGEDLAWKKWAPIEMTTLRKVAMATKLVLLYCQL